ncbi:MAG: methylated-DNA--[protein]-cysteine S-methyltransferase [Armatimonadetes bacterium]|nr:methylated-DNA--[protein]-cysteine S-methyltransferase [Armatimonadota bacterium]
MSLYYSIIETAFGWVLIAGRNGALVEVELPERTREEAAARVPAGATECSDRFGDLPERLRLYFDGRPMDFSDVLVKFEEIGEFEERVLREAMKAPYGRLTSYGALAAAAGSPRGARAVGNAMRRNPAPVIVPCHRVVHSDGSIGGYGGGIDLKRRLLRLEGIVL